MTGKLFLIKHIYGPGTVRLGAVQSTEVKPKIHVVATCWRPRHLSLTVLEEIYR